MELPIGAPHSTRRTFYFVAPQSKGFAPEGLEDIALFTAYIKAWPGEQPTRIFTAGGGSNSDTLLHIRSNVLNLPICKMKQASGAAGAAILAASNTFYTSLTEAALAMVQPDKTITPDTTIAAVYEQNYHSFVRLLQQKGYLTVA